MTSRPTGPASHPAHPLFAAAAVHSVASGTARPLAEALEMVDVGGTALLSAAARNHAGVAAYLATFSNVPPSEVAAVDALFGEIDIRGHLPVSIPGLANYGEGIQVQATRAVRVTSQTQ